MRELIDKESALDLVRDKCLEILDRCDSHYDVDVEDYVYDEPAVFNTILTCNKEIRNALSEMQPIDAEPVRHGRWLPDRTKNAYWICSYCGFPSEASGAFKIYKYCPVCGARMDQ